MSMLSPSREVTPRPPYLVASNVEEIHAIAIVSPNDRTDLDNVLRVGATSLFLATKVEENCRKMKELVISCVRVAQKDPQKVVDEQDREYWRWRDVILYNEDVMLEALCFDLSLEPPYKTLFDHLLFFEEGDNNSLRNAAWAFVNDSYLTMLCLMFPSKVIATSALYAAAKHCGVTFTDDERGRPWWDVIGVELGEIRKACSYMADIYQRVPSKAGKEGGMYERVSEIGDNMNDKTRARQPLGEDHRNLGESSVNGLAVSPTGSQASGGTHEKRSLRNGGEVELPSTANGTSHGLNDVDNEDEHGSPRKRQRTDNGTASPNGSIRLPEKESDVTVSEHTSAATRAEQQDIATQLNGTALHTNEPKEQGNLSSPQREDGSEEGEVEA